MRKRMEVKQGTRFGMLTIIKEKENKVMEQHINKSALVAEIDRRIKVLQKHPYENHKTICHLESLKQSLDTLEVKEVDLEKEFDNYAKDILACDVQFEPFTHLYNCAKYFYELGLAQKGE